MEVTSSKWDRKTWQCLLTDMTSLECILSSALCDISRVTVDNDDVRATKKYLAQALSYVDDVVCWCRANLI